MNSPKFLPTALAFQNQLKEINTFFRMQKLGLTTHHALILEALNTFGVLTQQEIASKILKDKSSVTRFLLPILNSGFVSISVDHRDKRKKVVRITEAGVANLTSLYEHVNVNNLSSSEHYDSFNDRSIIKRARPVM